MGRALPIRRRLGSPQGTYDAIDISNTSELRVGDVIYITGFGLLATAKFGAGEYFTVFGFDQGANKVGVTDESGDQHWFDGGSKSALLATLRDKVGYDSVTIYRPTGGAVQESPVPVESDFLKRVLFLMEQAKLLGLPDGYGPFFAAGNSAFLASGDFVLMMSQGQDIPRLYSVVSQGSDQTVVLSLQGTFVMTSSDWQTNDLYDPPIGTDLQYPLFALDNTKTIAFKKGLPIPTKEGLFPQGPTKSPGGGIVLNPTGDAGASNFLLPAGIAALVLVGILIVAGD